MVQYSYVATVKQNNEIDANGTKNQLWTFFRLLKTWELGIDFSSPTLCSPFQSFLIPSISSHLIPSIFSPIFYCSSWTCPTPSRPTLSYPFPYHPTLSLPILLLINLSCPIPSFPILFHLSHLSLQCKPVVHTVDARWHLILIGGSFATICHHQSPVKASIIGLIDESAGV